MTQLSVIGAGSWGSALALSLSGYYQQVHLWCYNQLEKDKLAPIILTHKNILASLELEPITHSQAILVVVPSDGFRQILLAMKPYLNKQHIAWASKGFDVSNGCLLDTTFQAILPGFSACFISGPSFASEVMEQKPTALVVSSQAVATRQYWANALQSHHIIRAYTNDDIIGAQIGASVKNVLAIAAGITAGLHYGANTQAALITRGLNEMMRLGLSLGAKKETFMGLTGLGDLVLTCSDDLSRNRQFGKALVKYGNTSQAKTSVNGTIEGLNALVITLQIAKKQGIEMPITQQVFQVIDGNTTPQEAINLLMKRDLIAE